MSASASHVEEAGQKRATANSDLGNIPGEDGLPLLGHAPALLKDARGLSKRMRAQYGTVYRTNFVGQRGVALAGADALQHVLLDRDRNFSNELGWNHLLGRLFPRGLMLMDFDQHRLHRRIMNAAFGRDALRYYVDIMNRVADDGIRPWAAERDFHFYPAVKQLTLDNAAVAFLGLELGPEATRINGAFIDTLLASVALVRVPVPGFAFRRGLAGRRYLAEYFGRQIPGRRGSEGQDMFTRLCNATNGDGESFSDQDIVDHMIFLMMAAHDTVTSTLTTAVYALGANPEWQSILREEAQVVGTGPLAWDDLEGLEKTAWVFNEAMRLYAPVPYIPRRALRSFEWQGLTIPANTQVTVSPDSAHTDESVWTEPERFDPERF
jgi:cytochrome P450